MNYEAMSKEELLDILAEKGQGVVNGNATIGEIIARIKQLSPKSPAPAPADPDPSEEDKPRGIFS
jgi:hypothetical protein|tara:strand:+ start:368 stop:562 length:195 start_codon:yes stop_codon:yes gene_type:complete